MSRSISLLSVLSLAFLAMPSLSSGQDQTREGFFVGAGLGWGSLGVSGEDGRESAGSGYLKLGGTLNDQVLLGAESNGWAKSEDGVTMTVGGLYGIIQFYPNSTSGFFLKGGAGFSSTSITFWGLTAEETGFGLIGGLGYDQRLGTNFSLSPYANYVRDSYDDGSTNVMQLGVGVTWH
jgi:hypothetical protein